VRSVARGCFFRITLITPAMASEPYWAEAPVPQHLDAVDGRGGDGVDVVARRAAGDRLLIVHQGLLVVALAVDQDEDLVGPERAEGRGRG
jgi:hypothetical protein